MAQLGQTSADTSFAQEGAYRSAPRPRIDRNNPWWREPHAAPGDLSYNFHWPEESPYIYQGLVVWIACASAADLEKCRADPFVQWLHCMSCRCNLIINCVIMLLGYCASYPCP